MASNTFCVPTENYGPLLERLDKLTRRAAKLGVRLPILTKIAEREEIINAKRGLKRIVFDVVIEAEPICVNGWTFLASIDVVDSEDNNGSELVINRVPGVHQDMDLPAQYRTTTNYCDHCNTARRRNSVYVLYSEKSRAFKQVGRNCLGLFLGGVDPTNIVKSMEYLQNFVGLTSGAADPNFFGVRPAEIVDLETLLTFTSYVIGEAGWLSRSKARELAQDGVIRSATADLVNEAYFSPLTQQSCFVKDLVQGFESLEETEVRRHKDLTADALDWVRSLRDDELNDYLRNLRVVCGKDSAQRKHIGIAASLLSAYQRAMGLLEQQKIRADANKNCQWVGDVKDKVELDLKVEDIKYWANNFGGVTAIFFRDNDNNKFLWKATNSPDLKVGTTYEVRGTIKAHTEFRQVKQNELTRCKCVAVDNLATLG